MERRKSLLFGLIGGFSLILLTRLYNIYNIYSIFGAMGGGVLKFRIPGIIETGISVLLVILSVFGLISCIYFSVLLIFDTFKTVHKR